MQRILILGGGVGGTLTADLLGKRLRHRLKTGEVTITVVDQTGQHVYQPGFMYIAMGGERAASLQRPERGLLDPRVTLVVGEVEKVDEPTRTVHLTDGERLGYDYLVLATGSRIVPEAIDHFTGQAYHFYTAEAATRLRSGLDAFAGGHRHRHRGDAVQVPAGAARGGLPDRGRAARAGPARQERAAFLLAHRARVHDRERVRDGDADARAQGHRAHLLQRRGDPERKVVQSLEGEELPYDLLILVPPHKGQQFLIDLVWRRPLAAGSRPIARRSRSAAAPMSSPSAMRPTCRCRRPARRPISRHPWSPSGSWRRSKAGVDRRRSDYLGRVMLFFEIGDGKGTLLRFDEHREAAEAEPGSWHLGKIVFNKTYWHTVPKGRV